jgi:hypothetical protein
MTRQHDAGMQVKEANREKRMPSASETNALGFAVLDPPVRRHNIQGARWTHHLGSPGPMPEQHHDKPEARVRLAMSVADAQVLANALSAQIAASVEQRILDQLWLRTVLIEQWRRTRIVERRAFQERADRVLSALDA